MSSIASQVKVDNKSGIAILHHTYVGDLSAGLPLDAQIESRMDALVAWFDPFDSTVPAHQQTTLDKLMTLAHISCY